MPSRTSVGSRPRALLAWSSGKDSAFALHVLREQGEIDVVGLLTSMNETHDRVAMHAVRRELVEAQARAVGLPLWPVALPWPCSNEEYERRMARALDRARGQGVAHVAFGDLHLEDIRSYRIRQLEGTGVAPLFPIWSSREATPALARRMLEAGIRAILTCVDPKQVPGSLAGRAFDASLLAALPPEADPCGENGEFHTFCFDGPGFEQPVAVKRGEVVERDGFVFADVLPVDRGER